MTGNNLFQRWQARVEKGLVRQVEKTTPFGLSERYQDALAQSRSLLKKNTPVARLFNSLGDLSLRIGFAILSLVLLRRAEQIDPKDPLPKINMSRAQLSLANRFLLRAPKSGGAAYNLQDGKKRLDSLLVRKTLPESKAVEATLLARRIDDRLAMWQDIRRGELDPASVKKILLKEDKNLRETRAAQIPSINELKKLAPKRTGFYYREYREQQRKEKEAHRGRRH